MNKTTEQDSNYNHLDKMDTLSLLKGINQEDKGVPLSVERVIPSIETLVNAIYFRMTQGGRLFYVGAGTSGRLGIVDASECPPTFGVSHDRVIGIIAGGDSAIRKAVEFAEDDKQQAWKDLQDYQINELDTVIGIAASGTTPYVIGGLEQCNKHKILTASICCNADSPLSKVSQHSIDVVVGPEFVTGSTRMKAGTAQKLVLNMISTSVMIKLGFVKGNKMVDMQLSNNKLLERGTLMVAQQTGLDYQLAKQLLNECGSVRTAIEKYKKNG